MRCRRRSGHVPTGHLVDELDGPEELVAGGKLKATLINAGIPRIFVNAEDIGFTGIELQVDINGDTTALRRFERLRAIGSLNTGIIASLEEAEGGQHTPKIAFVSPAQSYRASSGKAVDAGAIDLNVRALSIGKLHHAMMVTAAVAIRSAATLPGTLVKLADGGNERQVATLGHPSGTLTVGAEAECVNGKWLARKVVMSRSARVLVSGWVHVPGAVSEE